MGNGKNKTDRNKIDGNKTDKNKTKKTVATTKKKEAGKAAKQQETSFLRMKDHLVEQARGFNLLSNVFMSVALNDIPACQHVIRIITGNPSLTVKKIRSQYRISKITAHDAILDILAEDSDGHLVNIEIQRKDTIDHARRTRFYAAMIDSECLQKGKDYGQMPDVHIIYISETDLWEAGKAIYQVEKKFKGTEIPYDDGVHVTYVNAEVDDGSDIAKLMNYFKTANPEDMSQGDLSARVHFLKREEGGYPEMCEVSEKIYKEGILEGKKEGILEGILEGKKEGILEGKKEGILEGKKETAFRMKEKGCSETFIADILKVSVNDIQQWLTEF